jgi:hypothetical protein
MQISNNELRVMAHAINWVLNVPFDRTPEPSFSEAQRNSLGELLDFLHAALGRSGDALLEEISLDSDLLPAARQCVAAFNNEVGHSPDEVAAITGLPIGALRSLQARLSMT